MAKLVLQNITSFQNDNSAVSNYSDNNAATEAAMENTLSRDGTSPNQMGSNLDMNSWHILNLPEPASDTDPVRLIDLTNSTNVTNVLHTASTSSNTVGTGNKTFTVPSGLGFFPGQYILVQSSASNTNYMVGRVVSYTGTSLVVNVTTTAGSGTFANWIIDLSGAVGPSFTFYDTIVNAQAATVSSTNTFLRLSGYTTVGDGGDGLYKRSVSNPGTTTGSFFQSADGAYWLLVSAEISPEMFGCKGDGTTDDYTNFQNCINYVTSRGGGNIRLTPNKTYRILTATAVDTGLVFKPNVTTYFNGSRINFECVGGNLYGGRAMSNTRFYGPGTMATTVSTSSSAQSIWHSPLSVGYAYGDGGTVASPSVYEGTANIIIEGLTFTTVRPVGATCIPIYGGQSHITVRRCIFPASSTTIVAAGADWAFLGVMSSSDINLSRTNFNAGTAFTTHPNNLLFEGNSIGLYSNVNSTPLRVSGVFNTTIRNNDVAQSGALGVYSTPGDLGFEFAPAGLKSNASRNIVIEGNNIRDAQLGTGILVDVFPDNVYDAVTNPANPSYPYSPLIQYDGYPSNTRVVSNKVSTTAASVNGAGIWVQFVRNFSVRDNVIDGSFFYGMRLGDGCRNGEASNNLVTGTRDSGIIVGDSHIAADNVLVSHNEVYSCSSNNALGAFIYFGNCTNCKAYYNYLGSSTETVCSNGIKVDNNCVYGDIVGNVVTEVKTGGVAFFLTQVGISTVWTFKDNRYSGSNTYTSGMTIVPYLRQYSAANPGKIITYATALRSSMSSDTTPTVGQWEVGSEVTMPDSTASGQGYKSKCTVAGSPGTWVRVISIP